MIRTLISQGKLIFSFRSSLYPRNTTPRAESAARSQLANSNPENYLKKARRDLEGAGVPSTAIDRFLTDGDLSNWRFDSGISREKRDELCSNFFQALCLTLRDAGSVELDCDEITETNIAREKLCLGEITGKYSKIVDRWEQLERLSFDDPQLEEASKTFLYGFYQGQYCSMRERG